MADLQNPNAPEDVDVAALAAQLRGDGVAFGTENPVNAELGPALTQVLGEVRPGVDGPVGVVVLEHTPDHLADVRDIAHDVADAAGYDTVIVRTPHAAVGVSESLTRAQVERGQAAMVSESDYPEGLRAFAEAAEGFSVNWVAVLVVVVVVLAVAAAGAFAAARNQGRR